MIVGALVLICLGLVIWAGWPRGVAGRAGHGLGKASLAREVRSSGDVVRIATYNIHGGRDDSGRDNLDRIAADVATADIVAFQETRGEGFGGSQAGRLAKLLGSGLLLTPTRRAWFRLDRANALLSRLTLGAWQHVPLPHQAGQHRHFRALTRCTIKGAGNLTVLFTHTNTHKGAENPGGRDDQLRALADAVLAHRPCVLLGDLNAGSDHPVLQDLLRHEDVVDVISQSDQGDHQGRKDWIIGHGIDAVTAGYHESGASDHPAYWCDLRVPKTNALTATPADLRSIPRLTGSGGVLQERDGTWQSWSGLLTWALMLSAMTLVSLNGLSEPAWLIGAAIVSAGALLTCYGSGSTQRRIANTVQALGWGVVSGAPWLAFLAPVAAILTPITPQTSKETEPKSRPLEIRRHMPALFRSVAPLLLLPLLGALADRGLSALADPGVMEALLASSALGTVALARVLERHDRDQRIVISPLYQDLRIRLAVIGLVGVAGIAHLVLETDFLAWSTHWLPGLALLASAAWLLRQAPYRIFLVEGLLVAAIALLVEVEWLVPLLVPFYVALALDAPRTAKRQGSTRPLSGALFTGITCVALTTATILEAAAAL